MHNEPTDPFSRASLGQPGPTSGDCGKPGGNPDDAHQEGEWNVPRVVGSGKVAALHDSVTVQSETPFVPSPAPLREAHYHSVPETPGFALLRIRVAERLKANAREIGERWEARARSVALLETTEPASGHRSAAVGLIDSLASVLASDGAISEDMVARGLAFGVTSFEGGGSLHHTLKALDLLAAMSLYAVETAVAEESAGDLTPADGIRLSRRFQQGASFLVLSVAKGFMHALENAMRERFRHLRHDLRNPLGTIKSVLALMDDETISPEERSNPRFHAMAKRNARSLGELIGDRLSDAEAVPRAYLLKLVSLRTIACAVRRELRAESLARNTTVLVAGSKTRLQVDAVSLELMLHELLLVALQESVAGDELKISFCETVGDRATIRLQRIPARPAISQGTALERLGILADQMGATLEVDDRVVLSFRAYGTEAIAPPIEVSTPVAVNSSADAPRRSGHGDTRHDGRSPRQREHGQSDSL
jgi:signal transduction histidine kinase